MKKPTVHLPLQYFAEPAPATDGSTNTPPAGSDGTNTNLTASQRLDELLKNDKELQAEVDRRNSKGQETAVAREKEKWEAEAKAKADEAAKLAKMTADEKAKHEKEQYEKVMADREAAVTKRELTVEAISQLTEKGLPAELHKCLNYSDAESCKASIEAVATAFNTAVEAKVNDKLRGKPPVRGNGNNADSDPFLAALNAKN